MAKDTDHLAGSFDAENTGGLLSGFLAEEDVFDRRSLWRLGSWGVASVGAVTLALYASQSSMALRRDQIAAVDLARQAQQIQSVAKESQNETRRLASAIDTLNSDRDRLYSRVTVLEQGMDSVTGAIARQNGTATPQAASTAPAVAATAEPQAAPQNPAPAPAPEVSPVATTAAKAADRPPVDASVAEQGPATVASVAQKASRTALATPATPLVASKSMMAPPDAAAGKLIEPEKPANVPAAAPAREAVASVSSVEVDAAQADAPHVTVQRTEFGADVGGANSIGGLRALWRGLLKSNSELAALRPIIVVRESSSGLGMQLRLVAGPLGDAAAAAKICAVLIENSRPCETAVYDGQRLAMKADEPAAAAKPAAAKPSAQNKPSAQKRGTAKRGADKEPAKKPDPPSTLSSFFGRR